MLSCWVLYTNPTSKPLNSRKYVGESHLKEGITCACTSKKFLNSKKNTWKELNEVLAPYILPMAMISLFDKKKGNDEMSVKWGQLALFNPSIMYGVCLIFIYYICLIFVWGQFALFNPSIAAYSRIAGTLLRRWRTRSYIMSPPCGVA